MPFFISFYSRKPYLFSIECNSGYILRRIFSASNAVLPLSFAVIFQHRMRFCLYLSPYLFSIECGFAFIFRRNFSASNAISGLILRRICLNLKKCALCRQQDSGAYRVNIPFWERSGINFPCGGKSKLR